MATSLFDSPGVILVIVLVGALSQWLMKRRQANQADNQPDGDAPLPSPSKPQERSPRELDLQEALRQLLGGEPPPRAPHPPPITSVARDAERAEVWSDEEQFEREQPWMDEPQATPEAIRPPPIQTAPPSRLRPTVEPARQVRPAVQAAHRAGQLKARAKRPAPPATVVDTGHARRSREGPRAIGLLRDHRTVRQAFVASLVFGPPKAFES